MHSNRLTNAPIGVLYEDNHLLVVSKPAGMLSQGDISCDENVQDLMKRYVAEKYKKPGNVFLALVQRLDRPVGGVMVLARTSKAASRLSEQLRNRTVQKEYLAVVQGARFPPARIHRLEHFVVKHQETRMARVCDADGAGAKRAHLDFEIMAQNEPYALLKIQLLSGRFHQIRVQLSAAHMPIAGDFKYGFTGPDTMPGTIALWCYQIAFEHPTTGEILKFTSHPPIHLNPWIRFEKAIRII